MSEQTEQPLAVVPKEKEIQQVSLSKADIQTLVTVGALPPNCPPDVIRFFGRACAESNLSPFKRQIHLIKRWSKNGDRYTIQTGIDGYRAIANRTKQYAGNDDYRFDNGKTEYEMLQSTMKCPTTATSTVYRIVGGVRCPFAATASWEEYCPKEEKNAFMWNKMPFLMLGKCAEALALRKAFPEELGGIYTDEEMAQASMPAYVETIPDAPQSATKPFPARPEASQSKEAASLSMSWKEFVVPKSFPKTGGMKLSELDKDQLGWFIENFKVQTKDKNGNEKKQAWIDADLLFRAMLDEAKKEVGDSIPF